MIDPLERAERNTAYLRQLGVRVPEHLPYYDDNMPIKLPGEVAGRAIVSFRLQGAGHGDPRDGVREFLQAERLWPLLESRERRFLEADEPDQLDYFHATWQAESLKALLWALGIVPELGLPVDLFDVRPYVSAFPSPGESTSAFIKSARLRPEEEIRDMVDLVYRMHWVTREEWVNNGTNPLGFNDEIVQEWHHALDWMVSGDTEWEDADTST